MRRLTIVKMSGVDEILSYKKNPMEDFYALLNCDEHSSVSAARQIANSKNFHEPIAEISIISPRCELEAHLACSYTQNNLYRVRNRFFPLKQMKVVDVAEHWGRSELPRV